MLNNDYKLNNVLSILKKEKQDAEQRIKQDADNYFHEEEDRKFVDQTNRDIERFDNVKCCTRVLFDVDENSQEPKIVIYEDADKKLFYLYDEKTSNYMVLTLDEMEAAVKESPEYQELQKQLNDGHTVFDEQFLKEYAEGGFRKAHYDVLTANEDDFWLNVWAESPKTVYTLAPIEYLE